MTVDPGPLWLTLRLSLATTAALLVLGVPLALALARARPLLRHPLHALVNLPLVLPPSVLGFYLLILFSPVSLPGRILEGAGLSLAFTFPGLVAASILFSLPFMVNPVLSGIESLPPSLTEAAYVLGKGRRETFLKVVLPNIRPAVLAGAVLTFAHTVGEFGVVLMIGGKIPGVTKVASVAVYDEVESLRFGAAHAYSAVLCLLSFGALLGLFLLNRRSRQPRAF